MEAEPESQGEQGKTGIGAGNAEATDGQELLEEVALAHRQSGIEYDGREEEPGGGRGPVMLLSKVWEEFLRNPVANTGPI